MKKLSAIEFASVKREKLLDYKIYSENFDEATATLEEVSEQLREAHATSEEIPLASYMQATTGLAWESTDLLSNCYSAGHAVSELRTLFPTVLESWETYARYSEAYNLSEEGKQSFSAHMPLLDNGYDQANRLVCFAILLGWINFLPRLASLIDYNNPVRDGLLERLLAPYVPGRGTAPSECARHLPYYKTLKIFDASPAARPQMMAEYLDEWYHASRREPYHDSHKRGIFFLGYWSWEAAAITFALDIDDTAYRDAQFYPRELVEFARANLKNAAAASASQAPADQLRAKEGEPCPRAGRWSSLGIPAQTRHFELGEIMGSAGAPYGLTVWTEVEPS